MLTLLDVRGRPDVNVPAVEPTPLRRTTAWAAVTALIAALAIAGAVAGQPAPERDAGNPSSAFEAISLLGDTLTAPPLADSTRARYEGRLREARLDHESRPTLALTSIWLGRRTAYLGRFREAIDVYTRGLARHPDEPRLLRHRGHRYITVRDFPRAIADLERAARLMKGRMDETEPDGLPNARNVPTSTLQSNIWYHLGLAHYLSGDFERARRAYRQCLAFSKNPDMLCATTYWLYLALRRLGRDGEARAVLKPIRDDFDVIENRGYHRLLLFYKGELPEDSLLATGGERTPIDDATVGYGVGNWHLIHGRRAEAEAIFRRIVAGPQWPAFGQIAAEAELARAAAPARR